MVHGRQYLHGLKVGHIDKGEEVAVQEMESLKGNNSQ